MSLALFAIPVALALATLIVPRFSASRRSRSASSTFYWNSYFRRHNRLWSRSANDRADGSVTVELVAETVPVTIEAPGFEAITTTLARNGPADWQVALRPTVLQGKLSDAETSSGIAGASVALVAPDGTERVVTTDGDGRYTFEEVPEGAIVRFSSADHGVTEELVGERTEIDLEMRPSFVSGRVTDAAGAPLAGARVAAANGSAEGFTGPDGTFRLTGGADVGEVLVSAPGFADQTLAGR
jgi:hypothetical protein